MELKIEGLSKRYGDGVQALRDVTLTIPNGMFGLLGPNGAGKSTLMRTLATLQEADAGSAVLVLDDGERVDVLKDKERVRELVGYLPQDFGLYPMATAEALLEHLATLKGLRDRKTRRDTVARLLELTNLTGAARRPLGGFSGGMRQRFGIAQALLGDPKLVIVDEPTAGLDPEERVRFHNLLTEIGENVVVILSTHIVSDVADLCGRMAVLHEGRMKMSGTPLEAMASLRGKVWRTLVDKSEVEALQASHAVLSSRLVSGRIQVRAFADQAPPGFESAEPDLEDVYFGVMRGWAGAEQPSTSVASTA